MYITTLTGGGDVPQSINFTSTTIADNETPVFVRNISSAMGILSFGNCFVGIPVDTTDSFSVFRANSLIAGQPADGNGNLADTTDPGFVSPEPAASAPTTAGNYQLLFSSPLVEAGGAVTTSTIDLLGSPRFFDADNDSTATIDIGAYEFQGSETTADVEISGVAYNENSGQVVLTVESSAATTFTAQFSPDLSTSTWADFLSGSLNAGTNSVVIEGSFYGWPRDDAFFRIATP